MNFKEIVDRSPIGLRTIKTGIAVILTTTLALTPIIGNPFNATMGTILSMQNTVSNSFRTGRERVIGTIIGALIGFLFIFFERYTPPFIGLAIITIIVVCGFLKISHATLITITLCLLIIFNPNRGYNGLLNYTFFRALDTAIGVIIGALVNRFIAPPNHLKSLITELEAIHTLTKNSLTVTHQDAQFQKLSSEIKTLLAKLTLLYNNFKADEKYDNHNVSNENLETTVDACSDLYFHFRHRQGCEATLKDYHTAEIDKTLTLLENTVTTLKDVV